MLRCWKCAPRCALPGRNPPKTNCQARRERRFQFSNPHTAGARFVVADSHARFVSDSMDLMLSRGLLTHSSGEVLGAF